jgi:hypothetical protein
MGDSVVLNARTPPRTLILGFEQEIEEVVETVTGVVGDVLPITSLTEVNPAEWDCLITDTTWAQRGGYMNRQTVTFPDHVCVLYRASGVYDLTLEERDSWRGRIDQDTGHVSHELLLPPSTPEDVAGLVRDVLLPAVSQRTTHAHFDVMLYPPDISGSGQAGGRPRTNPPAVEPFLITAGGAVIAGRFSRSATASAWLLPGEVKDLLPWLKAALRSWSNLAPDRFPGLPDWTEDAAYATSDELRVRDELRSVQEERARVVRQLTAREAALQASLDELKERADSGARRLLTGHGDPLVEAVADALTALGFSVDDRDQTRRDEKLEDLRVTDEEHPGWLALAEVKGFSKGARTTGMTQFLRFQGRFIQDTGRAPAALWYIVNHQRANDPTSRGLALQGADEDVAVFADAGGVVIDTADLFRLVQQVARGEVRAADAREKLRNARGRLAK